MSTAQPPDEVKAKPPCPTEGGPPPGHNKTVDPHKPCKDKGTSNGNGSNSGIFLILPLLATGTAYVVRPERLRPRRRAR